MKSPIFLLMAVVSLALAACGGGSTTAPSPPPPPATYTISVTVINLAGTGGGLELNDVGGDFVDLMLVNANGTFTFLTALASGSAYDVTVAVQPSAPAQTCEVTHGTGIVTADVTNVMVDCGHNEWAWVGGSKVAGQIGTYGTQGTAAAGNVPGARSDAVTWTDGSGSFWLFGGYGYDSVGTQGFLNDLWKCSGGEWTWMGGSNVVNQKGTYGTQGMAAAGNIPGARSDAVTWTDASGSLWLFGGAGYDSTGTLGELNDLWEYNSGQWTWMGGSSIGSQSGEYGTRGVAAPGNVPGGRQNTVTWTGAAGNVWLFGGYGYDSAGTHFYLNDLWEYSAGQWTWIGGSNLVNQEGVYGTQGTPAQGNFPGARNDSNSWTDAAGNFWLFGGDGVDSRPDEGELNDLWKYDVGQWTWIGGSNVVGQQGTYGTQGMAANGNIPGAREGAVALTDAAGSYWLFGGVGYDSAGKPGLLNDLWKYSAGQWAWMGGSSVGSQSGEYGTRGVAAPGNVPGGRQNTVTWTDAAGNVWLFGGWGYDSTGTLGDLNDLWKYEP